MLRRVLLPLAAGAALGACSSGASPLTEPSAIRVGPNVLVGAARPEWEHTEYIADADPRDPNRVMVCSMLYLPARNTQPNGIYSSFDGGATWELFTDSTSWPSAVWDPACRYGTDGTAFFLTLG